MSCELQFFLHADKNGENFFPMPQTIWSKSQLKTLQVEEVLYGCHPFFYI